MVKTGTDGTYDLKLYEASGAFVQNVATNGYVWALSDKNPGFLYRAGSSDTAYFFAVRKGYSYGGSDILTEKTDQYNDRAKNADLSATQASDTVLDSGEEISTGNVGAGGTGARSYTDASGNVLLGNSYIEVGLAPAGSFGTTTAAPKSGTKYFHPDSTNLGLRSDGDGWDTGKAPTTNDFFLPGTIDEGFMIGWATSSGGSTVLQAKASQIGEGGVVNFTGYATTDKSSATKLMAETVGVAASTLQYTQVVSFGTEDKFYTTTVTLKNTTSSPIYNANYIRKFDPDQVANIGTGSNNTDNYFFKDVTGGVWAVASATSLGVASPVTDANRKAALAKVTDPFVFYTDDPRAQAISCGVGTDTFAEISGRGNQIYGTHAYADKGMGLEFKFPVINPGESVTFTYQSSLDPNFKDAQQAIEDLAVIITKQPTTRTYEVGKIDGKMVVQGEVLIDGATADSSTLAYQWYVNTTNSTTGGTKIEGATQRSYEIPKGLSANTTTYFYCVATETVSAKSATSSVATIKVVPAGTTIYSVKFNENSTNVVSNMPASQTLASGSKITEPATDPVLAGMEFDGWYTAATGGTKWNFASPLTTNQTLYAQWKLPDSSGPVISEVSGNPTSWVGTNPVLSFQVTDETAVASVTVSKDGGAAQTLTGTSSNYSFTANGNGTYLITATDSLGNVSKKTVTVSKIDQTKPVISTVIKNPSAWTNGSVTLTVNASDTQSGLNSTAYSFDNGSTWQTSASKSFAANQTVQVKVRDAAGNISAATTVSITNIDQDAPSGLSITYDTDSFKEFLNSITFGLFFKNTVTVHLNATDSASGVKEFRYTLTGGTEKVVYATSGSASFTIAPQFVGNISAKAVDNVGNATTAKATEYFAVDGARPAGLTVSTGSYTSNTWTKDSVTFTISGATADSGIAKYQYSIDGGKTWTDMAAAEQTNATKTMPSNVTKAVMTLNTNTNGVSYIFRAVSNSGMESNASAATIVKIDQTQPTISASGNTTTIKQNDTLTITPVAGISGVAKVEISKDGGAFTAVANNSGYTYQVTANGVYTVRVTNGAGVTKTNSITYANIDTVKPAISVDSHGYTENTWCRIGNVTLTASNLSANLGTTTIEYKIGAGAWQAYTGDVVISADCTATTYTFRAISQSGVTSAEQAFVVKRDTVAPAGTISIRNNEFKSFINTISFGLFFKNSVDVSISSSDATSGSVVTAYQKVSSGETYNRNGAWTNGTTFSVNANDKFAVYAKLTDAAGNETVINSDGIVVYTDSTQNTTSISFTKKGTANVTAKVNLNGNTVKEIKNGENLIAATNYTVSSDGRITFAASYLDSLTVGTYKLTISYNPMDESYNPNNASNQMPLTTALNLIVSQKNLSTSADVTITPAQYTYDGNTFAPTVTVKDGATELTANKDYTLSWTDDMVNVGEKTLTVNFTGSYTGTVVKKANIVNAAINDTTIKNQWAIYNGNEQMITAGASGTQLNGQQVTVKYSADNGATYTSDVPPKFTAAGAYTVYYQLSATNYSTKLGTISFTVTKATDNVISNLALAGWTFGDKANTPTAMAKYGAIHYSYSNSETGTYTDSVPTQAGTYWVKASVAETKDYNGCEATTSFVISAKTIQSANISISGVNPYYLFTNSAITPEPIVEVDGTILTKNVDYTVSYTNNVAAGTDAKVIVTLQGNYIGSASKTFEIRYGALSDDEIKNVITLPEFNANGWRNQDIAITAQGEWKLSTTPTGTFGDSLTISDESKQTGTDYTFYIKATTGEVYERTLNYKLDKVAPEGSVALEKSGWKSLLRSITFGLFFNDDADVTVNSSDSLSGIAKVEVYKADKELTKEELAAVSWSNYTAAIQETAVDDEHFIYYARITDNAGNMVIVNSVGATFDLTAPVISGVTNNESYYTTQKITITDATLESIEVNGEEFENGGTLAGNVNATYTIVATDKAGNKTTYTITMKPVSDIGDSMGNLNEGNVKPDDQKTIEDIKKKAESVNMDNATAEEKKAMQEVIDKCDLLLKQLEANKKPAQNPQTGDASSMSLWISLLFLSIGAVTVFGVSKRRKKANCK